MSATSKKQRFTLGLEGMTMLKKFTAQLIEKTLP